MTDINQLITDSYSEAEKNEFIARQLEEQIAQIPGAKQLIPARRYGEPVNLQAIRSNLTLSSMIQQSSSQLSHFLGLDPSIKHRMDEKRAAEAMLVESLRLQTERLRAKNQADARARERSQHSTIPWWHRRT